MKKVVNHSKKAVVNVERLQSRVSWLENAVRSLSKKLDDVLFQVAERNHPPSASSPQQQGEENDPQSEEEKGKPS